MSQSNISAARLKGFEIPIPRLDEQEEISKAIDAVDEKICAHARKRNSLQDLFSTLLHQLMTAEIRVNHFDLAELGIPAEENQLGL